MLLYNWKVIAAALSKKARLDTKKRKIQNQDEQGKKKKKTVQFPEHVDMSAIDARLNKFTATIRGDIDNVKTQLDSIRAGPTTHDQSRGTCYSFQASGRCARGKSCRFTHIESNQRDRQPCFLWNNGNCAYGNGCRFSHDGNSGQLSRDSRDFRQMPRDSREGRRNQNGKRCLLCGEPGHIIFGCPNYCSRCGDRNHTKKACDKKYESLKCTQCTKIGHTEKTCMAKLRGKVDGAADNKQQSSIIGTTVRRKQ